ncbi:TPA: hypothetical protein NO409_000009 [Salmonella enterica]|uniref:hypothetical protein n=1 Tax=Salmonella enterica TaxID=28901 RepID=UPI0008068220|nr:hypothetical protein [Salmonella enterica]EAY2109391.1 hypothetical protein [Salmonella enterica subsp. enterica serovar Typhimurium]EBF9822696.1 hypothetical protein [Salmonella enterica subsp. enterica serovar Heidelberg]EEE3935594.1 hypothetical protein [Salmonella enterica subsp. enterica serovar Infantis]EAB5938167.1 hypothetical protein [Salmonella enterica subsp. enterica serovar Minnesota]EAB8446419.1 hypothetical protein [Salmonella enterica subsp. enterica serovar Minnesota]
MKEVKIYTIVSDQLSPPITGESFCTDMVRHSDYAELEAKCAAMVAENAHMQQVIGDVQTLYYESDGIVGYHLNGDIAKWDDVMPDLWSEAPATNDFLAEVRAQARNEGINYAAGRLAAAFNHGFVDKPLAEVCDVVRMILDTKEELANSTLPATDGLSGEYAEKFLEEFAAQLRQGAAL